jgi:nicotinamide-nucleotide amidase
MHAEIITIGEEILIGQVIDTNSAFLAEELNKIGIKIAQITSISDDWNHIHAALNAAFERSSLILTTGGLGPTSDDITKHALAAYFNNPLVRNDAVLDHIRLLLASRGVEMNERNIRQADLPYPCRLLHNAAGTAQGMMFEKDEKVLIALPGVPFEMKAIMTDYALPILRSKFNLPPISHLTLLTHGLAESAMAARIESWERSLPAEIRLAYLPSPGLLRLRLSASGRDTEMLDRLLLNESEKLKMLIGEYVFGYNDDTIEQIVGELLREKGYTLAIAESCTGGKIASMITSVSGSSDYFCGSITAYSNKSKCDLLNVKSGSLTDYGAVSEVVAKEMAVGVRQRFGAEISVATTGIAGPTGGTIEKPVGTVWIGISTEKGVKAERFSFGEHRGRNIQKAAVAALFLVRKELLACV